MKYLLDTNTCVCHLRGTHAHVTTRLGAAGAGDVGLCSVVKAELRYGAERSANPAKNHAQLQRFFAAFPSLPFDDAAAECYGPIRAQLESQGTPIGPNDLMIASITFSQGLILVTHNLAEFRRIAGLQCEDWQ